MKFPFGKKLSDSELEQLFGRERLAAFSLARFGGVMISDDEPEMPAPAGASEFVDTSIPISGLK